MQPGFDWPRDPPVKIMLKADNGKFLYNHRSQNVITAAMDEDSFNSCQEFRERCQFSLELMYPIYPIIKGVKIRNLYKTIIETRNQLKEDHGLVSKHCNKR